MSVMTTALRESLKTLRLSGMLETLDARLTQAQGGELGHLDFLQVLCQDEITRRETVAFQRRLQRAKFEQQVTLEEFDFTASSKLPAAQIRDLGALRQLQGRIRTGQKLSAGTRVKRKIRCASAEGAYRLFYLYTANSGAAQLSQTDT
jgi:DNA replication protein DnaC